MLTGAGRTRGATLDADGRGRARAAHRGGLHQGQCYGRARYTQCGNVQCPDVRWVSIRCVNRSAVAWSVRQHGDADRGRLRPCEPSGQFGRRLRRGQFDPVCPDHAPVGAIVHITIQGCDTPARAAASLDFLGPSSFIGSSGGGDPVPNGADRA
jgi:hypothetical protein